MTKYYLMTANGTTPPRVSYSSLELAMAECVRLADVYSTRVEIVLVIGYSSVVTVRKTTALLCENDFPLPFEKK